MLPVLGQQLLLKLFPLRAWGAHPVLRVFPQPSPVLFANDAAVEAPDPAGLALLALDPAHHRLQRGDVGPVALEGFVAEGKAFPLDDQRHHPLFAVRSVVARISPFHQGVFRRHSFHLAAGQSVEQHVELGREQLALALLQMLFPLGLVRQEVIPAAV